jgi:hypothetical protein
MREPEPEKIAPQQKIRDDVWPEGVALQPRGDMVPRGDWSETVQSA